MSAPWRIVVVDDDPKVRLLLERALKPPEFETHAFHTGAAALRELGRIRPSCMISDILMPDVDGESLLRSLREIPGLERVPFIAVSAVRSEGRIKSVLAAGADAFLLKPFPLRELLDKVHALLERSAGAKPGTAAWAALPQPPSDPPEPPVRVVAGPVLYVAPRGGALTAATSEGSTRARTSSAPPSAPAPGSPAAPHPKAPKPSPPSAESRPAPASPAPARPVPPPRAAPSPPPPPMVEPTPTPVTTPEIHLEPLDPEPPTAEAPVTRPSMRRVGRPTAEPRPEPVPKPPSDERPPVRAERVRPVRPPADAASPPTAASAAAAPRSRQEQAGTVGRQVELRPENLVPGFGRFTRVDQGGRTYMVLTEASIHPRFTVTTVITEREVPLRRVETALPHPLAREEDIETVRRQIDLQHDQTLRRLAELVLGGDPRKVLWTDQSRAVDPALLAWVMSAVAQLAESENGTEETARLLRLTHERAAVDEDVLRGFHVTPVGRVVIDERHLESLPRRAVGAVARWCHAFVCEALQTDPDRVTEPVRHATARRAPELERVGFYARLRRRARS